MPDTKSQTREERLVKSIQGLAEMINTQATVEEMLGAFRALVQFSRERTDASIVEIQRIKKESNKALDEFKSSTKNISESIRNEIKQNVEDRLNKALNKVQQEIDRLLKEQQSGMNAIYDKLDTIKNGEDADPQVVAELIAGMIPNFDEAQKEINELKAEIEELKKRPTGSGGGVTNVRIQQAFKYLLKTEAPVGDIDGANTAYTVDQPIFAVLAFSLNGETIAQLPNYTVSDRTITFSTALPASYSGKDFEIKYI